MKNKAILGKIKAQVREDIDTLKIECKIDKWETIKLRLKGYLQKESQIAAKRRKETIADLSEQISVWEEKFPLNKHELSIYEEHKLKLANLLHEKTRSMIFRCRAKWYEEGEKSTKYFFGLKRARSNAKSVNIIVKDNGQQIVNLNDIIQEQQRFYTDLYSSNPAIQFMLKNNTSVRLDDTANQRLNEQFTIKEVTEAMKKMARDKAPGPDGLPVEVYAAMWDTIKTVFYDYIIEAYESEKMNESAMQGVLNLIPKANKDVRFLKNLRPITLLNVDYKIIEKTIASRLQEVLPSLIDSDQAGFMKRRSAAMSVRKLIDLMQL